MDATNAQTCRTCLAENAANLGLNCIMQNCPSSRTYKEILQELTQIQIMDELEFQMPQNICSSCYKQLQIAYNFIRKSQECNQKLLEMFSKHVQADDGMEKVEYVIVKQEDDEQFLMDMVQDIRNEPVQMSIVKEEKILENEQMEEASCSNINKVVEDYDENSKSLTENSSHMFSDNPCDDDDDEYIPDKDDEEYIPDKEFTKPNELDKSSNQNDSSATLTTQHVDRNQSELLTDMIETTNGNENEAQQINRENHDLANLLKSWNLFDELYKFLTSQELTIEQLKYMKIRHLDKIFAGQKINSEIIFEHKLSEWQNEQGIYYIRTRLEAEDAKQPCHNKEHLGEDNANAIAISCDAPSVELNVGNILKQTGQGKSLLNSYAKNKMLSPEARTFIVHTVIQFLIDSGRNLTVSQCKNFAEQIVCVFPTECIETYFAQTDKKLPPKGKLFDRYRSRKRKLAAELNQSPKRQRVQSLPEKEQQSSTISNSQELAEICMHLKHIRDWKEIVPKWSQTIAYRKQQFQNPEITLQQILKDWPLFKYFRAPDLVDIDYNHCHSYKILNFVKWDKFCTIAEYILRPRIKDAASKALLRQVIKRRNSLNIDNLSISYMMLLHSILPPPANVVNGCHIKYTIADSQNSFTVPVVNHLAHVNDLIKKKREQCLKGKTALLQPFIIVVGDEFQYEKFYVVLDDTKFLFSTYMEGIEYCFKLMNVLNLKYPNECFYVWIFIQKFLFDISKGTNFPLVNTLINDINVLISKP